MIQRGVLSFVCCVVLLAPCVMAQQAEKPAAEMPVGKVILFSSGVGYFERGGTVEPGSRVELMFKTEDINDVLKSLVVMGAEQASVTYASRDPVTKALKSFAVDITGKPTMAELLDQLRGARVKVSMPQEVEGVVLGVEKRTKVIGENRTVETDVLNVMAADGLHGIELPNIISIKLLDKDLEKELGRALEALAAARDRNKKPVSIQFGGKGKQQVAVAYIAETPVWKTSYRLVLDEKAKPYLQGWAIVENTTDSDWKDVELSLVSGQPISFVMDLYTPLYASRPFIQTELYASLRPQTYEAEMQMEQSQGGAAGPMLSAAPAAPKAEARRMRASAGRGFADADGAPAQDAVFAGEEKADRAYNAVEALKKLQVAARQGTALADLFEYPIAGKVSLERQKSAMFLIAAGDVEAEKLSIFDESTHAKFPLNGLDMTNSTGLYLMQGPVTVFEGGTYAGDARFTDIPAGDKRLISYSLDQKREVAIATPSRMPEELVSLKIARGVLIATRKFQRERTYTVNNKDEKERTVLIQYPYDSEWKLLEPKGEKPATASLYRFRMKVPAKKAGQNGVEKLTVTEERSDDQRIALMNATTDMILVYQRSNKASPAIIDALKGIIEQKNEIAKVQRDIEDRNRELAQISDDQSRTRENMKVLDKTSPMYNTYVKQWEEQEKRIQELRGEIKKLQEDLKAKKDALDASIGKLNVE